MALVFFLQTMFGIAFVIRTLHVFRARGVIRTDVVTKTGTGFVSALCLSQIFLSSAPLRAAFLCGFTVFACAAFLFFLEWKTLADFKRRVPLFLDRWILNLRLGNSLSAARDAALREESERLQALLRPVFETRGARLFRHSVLSASVLAELEQIARNAHAPLERLQNLRRSLRQAAEFRRRSGQAVRQTAIQAIVMLVLLLALAIFTVRRYGWTRSGDLVTISALLSVTGVLLMMQLARKTRWKL